MQQQNKINIPLDTVIYHQHTVSQLVYLNVIQPCLLKPHPALNEQDGCHVTFNLSFQTAV